MAQCDWCYLEMTTADDCPDNRVINYPDGESLPAVPYNDEGHDNQRCHDCNVKFGNFHHPGCDMERCPCCKGQLIGCGCLDDGSDDDEFDDEPYFNLDAQL